MEIRIHIRIIVTLISSVLITSCGIDKLSSKDISEFNAGTKAIVQTYNQPLVGAIIFGEQPVVQIIAVDGKKIDGELFKLDEKITVDVGLHKIEFRCLNRGGYDERDFTEIIQLDLKPR